MSHATPSTLPLASLMDTRIKKHHLYRYTISELCFYAAANTIAGLSISVAYRVIHLFNLTEFIQFLSVIEKPVFLISVIGIIQAVAFGSTYLILEARRSSTISQENYESLAKDAPFLEEIFIQRRVIGMFKRVVTRNL